MPTRLLSETARLFREDFRRRAQHLGLTQPQWRVLLHLSMTPGLTQVALAEKLEVHAVTVTQIVDRLVKGGWVRRAPHETDRRAVSLHTTEAAEPVLDELNRIAQATREVALAGFSTDERKMLEALLSRVKHNFCGDEKPRKD